MVQPSTKSLGLVISAIKNLREIQGSTSREILHYIASVHEIPATKARRQVQSALKRGVTYGILKKAGSHYSLPTDNDIARQEVAMQEIDLLDLYCRRKINRARAYKAPSEQGARSRRRRAGGCRCGRQRRRRRSRGCDSGSCTRRQRRTRRRRRSRRSGCRCGGRGGCSSERTETPEGTRKQKGDKLSGLDDEAEATAVVGTACDNCSSVSDSSSPERTATNNNNTEPRDPDMPLSH